MSKSGKMDLVNGGDAVSMNTSEMFKEEKNEVAIEAYNKQIDAIRTSLDSQVKSQEARAKELQDNINNNDLEIKPINGYILVRPFANNPFNTIEKTKSGIIIPEETMLYKNPDTGEEEKMQNLSIQAEVIEVSPLNRFVKPGDIIYYRRASAVPIPFFHQGFEVVAESSVQAVVGSKLSDRFKNFK